MSATTKTQRAKPGRMTRAHRTAILKALADPKRFELLERIAKSQCPLGCSEARSALAISPATLSHHVKELQTAGLVDVQREGKFIFLSLRPGVLQQLISAVNDLIQPTAESRLCKGVG
jgi:ArsR family transcriptional regulator